MTESPRRIELHSLATGKVWDDEKIVQELANLSGQTFAAFDQYGCEIFRCEPSPDYIAGFKIGDGI